MVAAGLIAGLMSGFLAHPSPVVQVDSVPRIEGRVFADHRPVDWLLEVRLESQAAIAIAYAYTQGSSEFEFRNVLLNRNENYFIVIEDPGFELLRHQLRYSDFTTDPLNPGRLNFSALLSLDLKRLPETVDGAAVRPRGPAALDIRELLADIPDEARREFELGVEARETGDGEAAISHFERSVELAPEYSNALNALGAEYLRAGLFTDAEETLDRARDLNPNDPVPLTNLGILYFQEGEQLELAATTEGEGAPEAAQADFSAAVIVLEEAVRLDPGAPQTNFYLGAALYKMGDYERAESMLLAALDLDSDMDEVRLMLLNVYTRQQRFTAALEQIDLYLSSNPEAPQKAQLDAVRTQIEDLLADH